MKAILSLCRVLICFFLIIIISAPLYAKDDKINPKEPGVYIITDKGLQRLLPNIVFDEQNLIFVESNNPPHFFLKDTNYFIVFGKYDMSVLTLNPMLFAGLSSLGKPRFIFGKMKINLPEAVTLEKVRVWETPKSWIEYFEG